MPPVHLCKDTEWICIQTRLLSEGEVSIFGIGRFRDSPCHTHTVLLFCLLPGTFIPSPPVFCTGIYSTTPSSSKLFLALSFFPPDHHMPLEVASQTPNAPCTCLNMKSAFRNKVEFPWAYGICTARIAGEHQITGRGAREAHLLLT